jgi:multiple sugar transport system ATP-binding protein
VAGLEDVTGGTIHIGDRLVNDVPPKDRDIAMVFQNYALYPHMTVLENLAFGLKLRSVSKEAIKQKVERAAGILGIEHLLDRKPKTLSGGQRQRVAVGRAIVREPKCFLFDEPLSNLDAKLRVEMRAEIKRIHMELRSTTIYVTHDQEEAMTLGDRVVVMKDGVIQQSGAPIDVYRRPANRFVAGFVGMPPMNFIEGTLSQAEGRLWLDEGTGRIAVPAWARAALERKLGSRVVLGVRPQALRDTPLLGAPDGGWLEVRVGVVEFLGDVVEVRASTAKHPQIVAHVEARGRLAAGEAARFYFDPERVQFFESEDAGRALASPPLASGEA